MKLVFNKQIVPLTSKNLENDINPVITLCNGRRLNFLPKKGNGFKNISLNHLILAVKNAALEPKQDLYEIIAFRHAFRLLNDKGYSDGLINKKNLLTRIITRIKHFFSNQNRKGLKEIDELIINRSKEMIHSNPQNEAIDNVPKNKPENIVTQPLTIEINKEVQDVTSPEEQEVIEDLNNVEEPVEEVNEEEELDKAEKFIDPKILPQDSRLQRCLQDLLQKKASIQEISQTIAPLLLQIDGSVKLTRDQMEILGWGLEELNETWMEENAKKLSLKTIAFIIENDIKHWDLDFIPKLIDMQEIDAVIKMLLDNNPRDPEFADDNFFSLFLNKFLTNEFEGILLKIALCVFKNASLKRQIMLANVLAPIFIAENFDSFPKGIIKGADQLFDILSVLIDLKVKEQDLKIIEQELQTIAEAFNKKHIDSILDHPNYSALLLRFFKKDIQILILSHLLKIEDFDPDLVDEGMIILFDEAKKLSTDIWKEASKNNPNLEYKLYYNKLPSKLLTSIVNGQIKNKIFLKEFFKNNYSKNINALFLIDLTKNLKPEVFEFDDADQVDITTWVNFFKVCKKIPKEDTKGLLLSSTKSIFSHPVINQSFFKSLFEMIYLYDDEFFLIDITQNLKNVAFEFKDPLLLNDKLWMKFFKACEKLPDQELAKKLLISATKNLFNHPRFNADFRHIFYYISIEQMQLLPLEDYKNPEIQLVLACLTNKLDDQMIGISNSLSKLNKQDEFLKFFELAYENTGENFKRFGENYLKYFIGWIVNRDSIAPLEETWKWVNGEDSIVLHKKAIKEDESIQNAIKKLNLKVQDL